MDKKTIIALLTLVASILIIGTMAYTGTKLARPVKTKNYKLENVIKYRNNINSAYERTK